MPSRVNTDFSVGVITSIGNNLASVSVSDVVVGTVITSAKNGAMLPSQDGISSSKSGEGVSTSDSTLSVDYYLLVIVCSVRQGHSQLKVAGPKLPMPVD